MGFREDLAQRVAQFAVEEWGHIPDARVPPTPEDLTFGNTGERLEVCVLYADLHRSTEMVDQLPDTVAASYYKAFLHCAAKVIKRNDGNIQAYDGDRVMAIYVGDSMAHQSVRTALELYWVVQNVINPTFQAAMGAQHRELQHTVGIDTGQALAAKTGVRVDSDLVWVGPAANYAAKLNSFSGLDIGFPTRITRDVFDRLTDPLKFHLGASMWEGPYTDLGQRHHYRSSYWSEVPRSTILAGG